MADGDGYKQLRRGLATACQQGDSETVLQILEDDSYTGTVDIDVGEGFTLLHLAAAGGHEKVVRLLLTRGAMLDSRNPNGWTPLMQAASYGHAHIVALLLQSKVDANTKNKLGASALTLAALGGHLTVVRTLLDHPGIDLNDSQSLGQSLTPLMAAAVCGYRSILKLLLERGSAPSCLERSTCWTTLMMASLGGSHGAAEMLLRKGADPNATDINERTALEVAAALGTNNKVRALLEEKTNNRTARGMERTKIFKAMEAADEDTVKQLLTEDPIQCNVTSREGATPLMIAAMLGHRGIAEVLVKRGANIDYQERKTGWTALMQATFHRHLEIVRYLLEAGADRSVQAVDGSTALDLALVIVNSETDNVGDELIGLLAPREELTHGALMNGGTPSFMNGRPSQMETSEDDYLKGGLKAWWSRMSNRFQNLKLSRTLRAGFVSSKVSSVENETLDRTFCLERDITSHSSGGSNQRRNKSVGFNLGGETGTGVGETHSSLFMAIQTSDLVRLCWQFLGRDFRVDLSRMCSEEDERHSLHAIMRDSGFHHWNTLQPSSFIQTDSQMPTVIPPFLPTPSFEFNKADRHKRNSIKTMRHSITSQGPRHLSKRQQAPNRLLFTRRQGTAPSTNSLLSEGVISPVPSGNPLRNGEVNSHLLGRKEVTRNGPPGAAKEAWKTTGEERPSDELARFQKVTANRLGSASSTSSTLSGSTKNPDRHNVRRVTSRRKAASSNSTLTPPTSPTMVEQSNPSGDGKNTNHASRSVVDSPNQDNSRKPDELSSLLERLSLSKFRGTFEEQEVDMDTLLTLSEPDLKEMGIASPKDRGKLIKAISELDTTQPVDR